MSRSRWGSLFILWCFIILLATLWPGNQLPDVPGFLKSPGLDSVVHFVLFGVFAFLLTGYLAGLPGPPPPARIIFLTLVSGILYGLMTEFFQHILPIHRQPSITDLFADVAGTITGLVVGRLLLVKAKI